MKKIMFLIGIVTILIGCDPILFGGAGPAKQAFPPGTDWSLDIVKFKNPEYKNHILTRQYPGKLGLNWTKYVYINDTPCYRLDDQMVDRATYADHAESSLFSVLSSLSSLFKGELWYDLGNNYYLCNDILRPIFCYRDVTKPVQSTYPNYYDYNLRHHNNEINNLFLMRDEWATLPDTFPYTTFYRYHTKPYFDDDIRWGGWKQDTFMIDTLILFDFLYSTTDAFRIIDDDPIAEHYVVTAKSLFDFTGSSYNKIEKVYLSYDPLGPCERMQFDLPDNIEANNPYNWDSLIVRISQILREVVESGQLQEYVEYDLRYNKVK